MPGGFTLNTQQVDAIERLKTFLKNKNEKMIVLEGYAGTGKSTIISHLFQSPEYQKLNICMSATTNKAVSVLKEMGKVENKKIDYLTIHKLMKIKRTIDSDGKQQFITSFHETTDSRNKKCKSIFSYNVIVIDEASMINKYLFHDLEVISRRIAGKIIFVGDRNQLPPVNQLISDVFATNKYQIISLTKVMRSSGDNNIVNISNYIRESINNKDNLRLKTFKDDNVKIHRAEKKWIDNYVSDLTNNNHQKSIILAYTNAKCSQINNTVRTILFPDENTKKKFLPGEHIVFNNYYQNSTNKYYTSQTAVVRDVSFGKIKVKKLKLMDLINLKNNLEPFNNQIEPSSLEIDNPCPICKSDEIDLDIVTVCEHKLCIECAKVWLNKHKCCPLCRIDTSQELFTIKEYPVLSHLLNRFAVFVNQLEFEVYGIKLVNGDTIYTLTDQSKQQYKVIEFKLKEVMAKIKQEVLKSKKIINFGLILLSRMWLYIFNNIIDLFAEVGYGYCITSHKSQGSTYNNVYVDVSNILNYNRDEIDGLKCLYTAVTRTADNLHIFY